MQDITPFAGLFPVIELWNRLHLDEVIELSVGVARLACFHDRSSDGFVLRVCRLLGGPALVDVREVKDLLDGEAKVLGNLVGEGK